MNTPREPVMVALKQALRDALPEFVTVSRRLRDPTSIKPIDCPALLIDETGELVQQPNVASRTTITVDLWVILKNGAGPDDEPIVALNNVLDLLDAALRPPPGFENFTLGGLCQHCWIEGEIAKDGGEITKIAMAKVPLRILIP